MLAKLREKKTKEIENAKEDIRTELGVESPEPDKEGVITVSFKTVDSWKQWPKSSEDPLSISTDRFGNEIELNENQLRAVRLAVTGADMVLLGAAGTGKTTSTKKLVNHLVTSNKAGILKGEHNYLPEGTPGIVVCAYTRRAVTNIKKNMPDDMKQNCITIHKLLEFYPKQFEVIDNETGEPRITMKFVPKRDRTYQLHSSIRVLLIEESSMLGTDLWMKLIDALPRHVQIIFIGDIQQLPPIFSPAILGFKIIDLERNTIELTQVYRQAMESPIIKLAHRILSGVPIPAKEFPDWNEPNLTIHPWKKKIDVDSANLTFARFIIEMIERDQFNVDEDIILCPFNLSFGTIEINKVIASHLAVKHNKTVFEIVAGFNRHYYAVGDRVMLDKEDATIEKITWNGSYAGALPQKESVHMDYWGRLNSAIPHKLELVSQTDDDVDKMLDNMIIGAGGDEDRVNQASHRIHLKMTDTGDLVEIDTAGEINSLLHGYALTVHKAQGSEWRKVILALHRSHATMMQRELLYTAVTRAKETLYIICEPETFVNGILNQRYPGNTLKEKAQWFKGKIDAKTKLILGDR